MTRTVYGTECHAYKAGSSSEIGSTRLVSISYDGGLAWQVDPSFLLLLFSFFGWF